jgi:hypothetical protein
VSPDVVVRSSDELAARFPALFEATGKERTRWRARLAEPDYLSRVVAMVPAQRLDMQLLGEAVGIVRFLFQKAKVDLFGVAAAGFEPQYLRTAAVVGGRLGQLVTTLADRSDG